MRKVQVWFLIIIVMIQFLNIVTIVTVLNMNGEATLYQRGMIAVSFVVTVFLILFSVGTISSTINSKDYYKTYDELQESVKEANESYKLYKHASNVLGNHYALKHFIDNSGFRMMRNRYIYKRKV